MIELSTIIAAVIAAVFGAISALAIERYRSKLQTMSRYHESQLNMYMKLWNSLYDLKLAADRLWETADIFNLREFMEQLQKTEDSINRNILLIEKKHIKEQRGLIKAFWDFQMGKEKLINLRKMIELYERTSKREIEEVIDLNRQTKDQYAHLIKQIERSFRRQLRTLP